MDLLINQARKYMPEVVVIANEQKYPELKEALEDLPIKVWAGSDAIAQVVQSEPIDMVLTAMVGYAGLKPTIAAIKAGKAIALANKETLVVAGELITALAVEHKVPILPVDSEHSAIFQCLAGEWENPVEKILLTASGGPFRTKTMEELAVVTKAQALKHPNWSMGAKITIDSASMMNKGFEMIEAKWLFGVTPEQIQVVVHPQSVIHSMVQFEDGAVIAQLGIPDMKLPISYAFSYPKRLHSKGACIILILLTTSVGQPIVLYVSALGNVDASLVEAANVDGATSLQAFWKIKWPQIMPTTLYIVVITTINSFQCFALIQLLTSGGPNHSTDTIMYYIYYSAFKLYRYGYGDAMGVVLAIMIAILSAIQFKFGNSND